MASIHILQGEEKVSWHFKDKSIRNVDSGVKLKKEKSPRQLLMDQTQCLCNTDLFQTTPRNQDFPSLLKGGGHVGSFGGAATVGLRE